MPNENEKIINSTDLLKKNDLEEQIETVVKAYISKIRFSIIIKPAIIPFVALIISFSWIYQMCQY
jgi:hypothetical protein